MPELPEVEAVRRVCERVLVGRILTEVEVVPDEIVFRGGSPDDIRDALVGKGVERAGRLGKAFWLDLGSSFLLMHLGMSGWLREVGRDSTKRLLSHGSAPLDDPDGHPRFLKLLLVADDDGRVAFTDGRRLGRIEIVPDLSAALKDIGPDALTQPRSSAELAKLLVGRKAPIKALLLDQKLFAGVGNWVADEALYHAGIAPMRQAASLTASECDRLANALTEVLETAVAVDAESERFPVGWLFHHRWGGSRGKDQIDGAEIRRDKVGGRTSAWVPSRQT